ncbi:MAG: HigA family addiction module antidote protein [Verrucomicrobiae bacterium]|nr:HigA family addiction module antidote protein [Verrucomicrobiae bacterium]MCB1132864.1 HigA family addiction module antidote protein [Verrucomicrobiae bacterium]MCP5533973.1 HigA family addiction module antidote protein [Akkermansiaceae bacterium]
MKKKPQPIPLLNFFAETLRETLEESDLSQAEIARRCGIPAPHLTQMKQGKRRCTPEYDLRLSAFFRITPGMWMNLQLDYEFMRTQREMGEQIIREVRPHAA